MGPSTAGRSGPIQQRLHRHNSGLFQTGHGPELHATTQWGQQRQIRRRSIPGRHSTGPEMRHRRRRHHRTVEHRWRLDQVSFQSNYATSTGTVILFFIQNYRRRQVDGQQHLRETAASGNAALSNDQIRHVDSHPHSIPAHRNIVQISLRPTWWHYLRTGLLIRTKSAHFVCTLAPLFRFLVFFSNSQSHFQPCPKNKQFISHQTFVDYWTFKISFELYVRLRAMKSHLAFVSRTSTFDSLQRT